MILRDPVHGLVAFEGDFERVALALLATREVQRLRRVRQLGLTSLVFPGAEHSRFAHALGAAHVMTRLLERAGGRQEELPAHLRVDPMHARDAFAAAMLHDLGHGPFSHLFEEVLPAARPHEEWTTAILTDPSTEVCAALRRFDPAMPERVASLVRGEHPLPYMAKAVSGTFDVDRCDYLLRDSHMTGVAYGIYDPDVSPETPYVIFNIESTLDRLPSLAKGLPPIEGATTFRVLADTDQWRKLAPQLVEQPDTAISILGDAAINPKRPDVITVRASMMRLVVWRSEERGNGETHNASS